MSPDSLSSGKLKNSPTQKLTLRHRLGADALVLDAQREFPLEGRFGSEVDGIALDLLAGGEVLFLNVDLGEALRADADDERAEVLEHYAATAEQRVLHEGFDAREHGQRIGLGTGGGVGDVLRQLLEGVVTGLRCLA